MKILLLERLCVCKIPAKGRNMAFDPKGNESYVSLSLSLNCGWRVRIQDLCVAMSFSSDRHWWQRYLRIYLANSLLSITDPNGVFRLFFLLTFFWKAMPSTSPTFSHLTLNRQFFLIKKWASNGPIYFDISTRTESLSLSPVFLLLVVFGPPTSYCRNPFDHTFVVYLV